MSELPKVVIARRLGIPTNTVTRYQWQDANREHVRQYRRERYQVTKVLGGIGETRGSKWTYDQETQLKTLHLAGLSFGLIGTKMGVSRNTIAGKLRRMKRDGLL